jgi:hypothetical protein
MVVWEENLALADIIVMPPLIPPRLRATIALHTRGRTDACAGGGLAPARRQRSNGVGTSIGASSGEGASS